ncbi:sensor histidine kinase [Sphaerisporangium corydalis]|uniref:histidine kinase n=1 Tax=Sphaerisporangium corydalis TaxID=1441875 RepID=A0ABV9EGB4_9ACTN|nr:sensor histidine kinase [Sphaerisporangium corydalis]
MRERWAEVRRGSRYLLIVLLAAVATTLLLPVLAAGAISAVVCGPGSTMFSRLLAGLRWWAGWHRLRAAATLGFSVPARPAVRFPPRGVRVRWRLPLDDAETGRDLRWALWQVGVGVPAGLAALACVGGAVFPLVGAPLWWAFPEPQRFLGVPAIGWGTALATGAAQAVVAGAVSWWAVPWLARLHARGCLAALAPSPEERLTERIGELAESRAGVLDAHAAELRRIERDLHDGTQARLVAIAMRLGLARESLPGEADALATLLKEAHEGAEEAMTELRDVVRTIYPPILADRGLAGAVSALAARSGIPVQVELGELGGLPAAVETCAYFIVAEALTNAAKHSGAGRVLVRLTRRDDRLLIEVTDDGTGGADEGSGTGLAGVRHRATALDGTVLVSSPPSGPTVITAELPCAS